MTSKSETTPVGALQGAASAAPPRAGRTLNRILAPDSTWSVIAVWAVWALVMLGTALVTQFVRPHELSPNVIRSGLAGDGFLWPLRLYDYSHYLTISKHGYPEDRVTLHYAFFPLWPAVLAVGGKTVGAGAIGSFVAIAASLAAFVGIAVGNPLSSVRRTAVALACFPTSYALLLAYPDGLALAAAVWAWVLASRDRWAAAGALGFVAATARPNGFLIAIPLAFFAWRSASRGSWTAAAGPLVGFGAVLAYFWARSGDPFATGKAVRMWLHVGPLEFLQSPLASGLFLEAVLAALAVALCALCWASRLDRGSALFATAVVATKLAGGVLQSTGRRTLFAFPLVWAGANARWFGRAWAFALLGATLGVVHVLVLTSDVP